MTHGTDRELREIAACTTPYLIGVRHHSPVCAAAVPGLLDAFAPARVMIELPPELDEWLPWLGKPDLQAPVALAAVNDSGSELAFYPFADFSPELAAVRWATRRGVPIEAFDLPLCERPCTTSAMKTSHARGLLAHLCRREDVDDFEELWDRMVEARSLGAPLESVRRAALYLGWALRLDAAAGDGIDASDLARETHMRRRLAEYRGEAVAAVVGAFHAAALLPDPLLWEEPESSKDPPAPGGRVVTSLIPYSHDLLDSRSGYPAGIRDPMWQQWVWQHADDASGLEQAMATAVSTICSHLRSVGHVAGVPEAREVIRVARDLARLRRLPAPARREWLEALELALGQGERLGRGQVVAAAIQRVLVGGARGRLAPGTPRSGLAPHVEQLLTALKLPGPDRADEPVELVLDPARSELDRLRHVALMRLATCAVPYAEPIETVGLGAGEALTQRWIVRWTPSTSAMLELAGVGGVTLDQATRGAIGAQERRLRESERWTCTAELRLLQACAESALHEETHQRLSLLSDRFANEATLPELLEALVFADRLARGHVAALPAFTMPDLRFREDLLAAALRSLTAISGSNERGDAQALLQLVRLYQHGEHTLGGGQLGWAVDGLANDGSPLMQGAAGAARVELERQTPQAFAARVGSWVDAGDDLAERLTGALLVASPRFESDPTLAHELIARVDALDDASFMHRLPALREGFDALSRPARARLLDVISERVDVSHALEVDDDPATLADWAEADLAGRRVLERLDLALPSIGGSTYPGDRQGLSLAEHGISAIDRWRLILGQQRRRLTGVAGSAARALDELYGHGRHDGVAGPGGGQEEGFPSVREWSEVLEALFGAEVREEVLGRAALDGRTDVLTTLDPDEVTPSIELLQQVLSLKGSLGEAQLARLRPLVDRVIRHLVDELAVAVRPALTGLACARPTRRPSGPLDLRRTIRTNLRTVQQTSAGDVQLVPERLVFRTRARRSLDWHILFLVDVSGSMEPSVIYSALMAAILSGLPALSVQFLAFDTRVIDLSHHVSDPLSLLLEVEVGGGTHIAKALRFAATRIHNPQRTLVILISDFEEGWPIPALTAQVRALVETGATCLGLAALDAHGNPRCARAVAERVVAAGMPIAALTPLELARWVGEKIR